MQIHFVTGKDEQDLFGRLYQITLEAKPGDVIATDSEELKPIVERILSAVANAGLTRTLGLTVEYRQDLTLRCLFQIVADASEDRGRLQGWLVRGIRMIDQGWPEYYIGKDRFMVKSIFSDDVTVGDFVILSRNGHGRVTAVKAAADYYTDTQTR